MATVARQPFVDLDTSRLQKLQNVKNRQNAISLRTPALAGGKRKAERSIFEDLENIDPLLSAAVKRSKGGTSVLAKGASINLSLKAHGTARNTASPAMAVPTRPTRRQILKPNFTTSKAGFKMTATESAGRSPVHGKRFGIFGNRQSIADRYHGSEPALLKVDCSAPFSLDAAIRGTAVPSPKPRPHTVGRCSSSELPEYGSSDCLSFEIYEDTQDQEMTNLLQHSTCILDISSDDESEQRANREKAEGRNKENIPPGGDFVQTTNWRNPWQHPDGMKVERRRAALEEISTADLYSIGDDDKQLAVGPRRVAAVVEDTDDTTKPNVDDAGLSAAENCERPLEPDDSNTGDNTDIRDSECATDGNETGAGTRSIDCRIRDEKHEKAVRTKF